MYCVGKRQFFVLNGEKKIVWCELILIWNNDINTILFHDISDFIVWKRFGKVYFGMNDNLWVVRFLLQQQKTQFCTQCWVKTAKFLFEEHKPSIWVEEIPEVFFSFATFVYVETAGP